VFVGNSAAEQANSWEIISAVFHGLDADADSVTKIDAVETDDLNGYLTGILSEIESQVTKRSFKFASDRSEFCATVCQSVMSGNFSSCEDGGVLASRLLRIERSTDDRYGHLGQSTGGVVKKGSFVQFLYKEDGLFRYLAVKIDHQQFLDEDTFKIRLGLAVKNKIYKACRVRFDESLKPEDVFVYDNNSKPSAYWWDRFLELEVVRDDSSNTKTASTEVIKYLERKLKDKFPLDHTHLRNAAIVRFRQKGVIDYPAFVESLLGAYVPLDESLASMVGKIKDDLLALPEKRGFDTQFELTPGDVSFKVHKVKVRSDVIVQYDEGMQNINEKIWREESLDGRKFIVIAAEEGYMAFTLKDRKP
jgi:hypothetical protein